MQLRQSGFTLIELMISMVIGLVLIAGVVTVITANSQSYRFQQALVDVQEGGEYAIAQLVDDIRLAGFGLDNDQILIAYDQSSPSFPSYASGASNNTEVLEIRYQDINDRDGDNNLTEVGLRGYFIRPDGNGRNVLMVFDTLATADDTVEVLEGVERIVYSYLIDDTGNDRVIDRAKRFSDMSVTDWDDTIGLRLEVLVSSQERNVLGVAQNRFDFSLVSGANATTFTPTDNRYYQVFTSTVEMRNRVR